MFLNDKQANEVTLLAVTMFGAAPGAYKAYLDQLYIDNDADLVATVQVLSTDPVFIDMYNGTPAENAAKIIANLSLDQITDTALNTLAETYITAQVNQGVNLGELYGFALNYMATNAAGHDFSEALAVIDNKVAVANSFTAGYGKYVTSLDVLINSIDAENTSDMNVFWSSNSRADLVIEDIGNDSHQTTIGWQSTDAGDVDYSLYFDPTNITVPASKTGGSQLSLELLDQDSMAAGNGPLDNNPYVGVVITVGGVEVTLAGVAPIVTTYADLVAELNLALVDAGYPDITAALGSEFDVFNANDGQLYTGTTIVLTNAGPEVLAGVGWTTGDYLASVNLHGVVLDVAPLTAETLTQTDVILDWVGRGSKSGDFLAGSMSTGDRSDSQGIQQFNVQVDRDSWLNTMSSTNNGLEVVNVENIGENGSLKLDGVGVSTNTGLVDVRVFDASAMMGDVTLAAHLTGAVTDKYLDITDTGADSTADNSELGYASVVDREFSYDLGTGSDKLNLTISDSNLLESGTTTREDFELQVQGDAGADSITLSIVDAAGALATSAGAWYTNHQVNSHISISAGMGDDTVMTTGAGDFDIMTGSGDDVVYTDNAAVKSQWMVNAAVASATAAESNALIADQLLFKSTLTVTFSSTVLAIPAAAETVNGFESTVTIPTSNYLGTQAEVNQAIKDAINNDAVLNKLLVAADGPGHTLVITSLVDGAVNPDDIAITLNAATLSSLSAAEQSALDTAWETLHSDPTLNVVQADLDNAVLVVNAAGGYAAPTLITNGVNSFFENSNTINAGADDDVIVLSTEVNSNETIVFDGIFGNDTIYNFDNVALSTGLDTLDFTSYMKNVVSSSGSVGSQVDAVTVQTNTLAAGTTTLDANDFTIITDFAQAGAETWAAMTSTNLLAAIQDTNATSYANIVNATLDASTEAGTVGLTSTSIVMIDNDTNAGEYKVFELTSLNSPNEFITAKLLGTVDLGSALDGTTVLIA